MVSPLVTHPAYGSGRPSMPVGVSRLPEGGPTDRGLPLDSGIPGTSTYTKPVDDIREDKTDDAPIYRVDGPDDLAKDRSRIDTREDNANKHDGIGAMGAGEWDTGEKTKYPYRDGIPHTHSAAMVVGLWRLRSAPVREVSLEDVRVATTLDQIVSGLSAKVIERSAKCKVKLKRADTKNLRWIFSVDAGNGPKVVRMKASRKATSVVSLAKMDIAFSCSCHAWRWLGPEHNAQKGVYLDGKAVGTASPPDIKDPERVNKVCKHVAAVVKLVRKWEAPSKSASENPFVPDTCWEVQSEPDPQG